MSGHFNSSLEAVLSACVLDWYRSNWLSGDQTRLSWISSQRTIALPARPLAQPAPVRRLHKPTTRADPVLAAAQASVQTRSKSITRSPRQFNPFASFTEHRACLRRGPAVQLAANVEAASVALTYLNPPVAMVQIPGHTPASICAADTQKGEEDDPFGSTQPLRLPRQTHRIHSLTLLRPRLPRLPARRREPRKPRRGRPRPPGPPVHRPKGPAEPKFCLLSSVHTPPTK